MRGQPKDSSTRPATHLSGRLLPMPSMPCHLAVLEAARNLVETTSRNAFTPDEIFGWAHDLDPTHSEAKIRVHVTERCCVNASRHHVSRYPYFERIGDDVYRLV
jgi:hypothetical protein